MSHSTKPVSKVSGTNTPLTKVDSYIIAQQDDSTRPAIYASGDLYTFYTTTRESGGDFNFFDFFNPPNNGPLPHYHPFEAEVWNVIDGEFQYSIGNNAEYQIIVPEGTTVFSPRRRIHQYFNLDSTATMSGVTEGARTLSMTTPGALDLFFDAASERVVDINEPIPPANFDDPDVLNQAFINLTKFHARTDAGAVLLIQLEEEFVPPDDGLDYLVVLPEDATEEKAQEARALAEVDGIKVWTTGTHEGIDKRPTFTGDFDVEYTSLASFEETGGEFSHNEFSLEPTSTETLNTFVEATLTSNQVASSPVSDASGVANFSLNEQGGIDYRVTISGLDFGEFISDSYRYIYDAAPGFSDFTVNPITIINDAGEQVTYDGYFTTATVNAATEELVYANGVYRVLDGSLGDPNALIEVLRDDYYNQVGIADGAFIWEFFDSPRPIDNAITQEVAEFPDYIKAGLSQDISLEDQLVKLPFGETVEQHDWIVIPSKEFAFDVFRDTQGNPAVIVGEGWSVEQTLQAGTFQTPENTLDDITTININLGEKGSTGSNVFNILDLENQDETGLVFSVNDDGSITVGGTWDSDEKEIPSELTDFLENGGIPGQESEFYVQVDTKGNPDGEIRGQIPIKTNDFPEQITSENHEIFYVKEGQLSFKINDEVQLAEEDTYVYVAPGNEYSFANFGTETVESLAVTVTPEELHHEDDEHHHDHHDEPLPSPLKAQEAQLPKDIEVLGDNEPNIFNPDPSSEEGSSSRRIYGGGQNDEIYADSGDRLFGREGNDILDASQGKGGNRLYGGKDNDEILLNKEDRGFGGHGNDIIDAAGGEGYNLLDGGDGDDRLFADSNNELRGGDGDDLININGSNNVLYGGYGADEFGIFNGRLPDAVAVEYSDFAKSLLPDGLSFPDLMDAQNIIADFEIGRDKIVIDGVFDTVVDGKNISFNIETFDQLELLPTFGDLESTSITVAFTEDGVEKEISLASVNGIYFNELSASDFEFV
ncbi:MAG: cupin domain-containing protein [Cyanobacteria bacterium J06639_18]